MRGVGGKLDGAVLAAWDGRVVLPEWETEVRRSNGYSVTELVLLRTDRC